MATIKLYGASYSTCTRRVITTLNELNLPFELVPIELFKGEHKAPDYLAKIQPFGQIPALVDTDGTHIYESRAIQRYVALKYGKGNVIFESSVPR